MVAHSRTFLAERNLPTPSAGEQGRAEHRRERAKRAVKSAAAARDAARTDVRLGKAFQPDRRRLSQLYEISKLLTAFESVDASLPSVLAAVSETINVSCAVVIEGLEGQAHVTGWRRRGIPERAQVHVEEQAREVYEYLMNASSPVERKRLGQRPERSAVAIPLVVDGFRIFGVLYVQAATPMDKMDLTFVSAVANQLAIAIDRRYALDQREALRVADAVRQAVESEARRTEVLAEASLLLAEALEYPKALPKVTELIAARIATACLIRVQEPDGSLLRAIATSAGQDEADIERLVERLDQEMSSNGEPGPYVLSSAGPGAALSPKQKNAQKLLEQANLGTAICAPIGNQPHPIGSIMLLGADVDVAARQQWQHFAVDLGRRIDYAIEAARLYRAAQQATQARDEFLSVAAHELKTPLTSLQLLLQSLVRADATDAKSSPELFDNRLRMLERSTSRLSELVVKLLDASRISAGRLQLEREDVDLAAITREVCARFTAEAQRAGSSLAVYADSPAVGSWDPMRIEQVITNLLSNAVKYAAGAAIDVRVESSETAAKLIVRDRGIGIPENRLDKIFDRFERAASSRHYGGLGLGLYISRQIVEAHGGSISVTSCPGEGSTFTVELPCK
jgi:signal transduction histidine kinase